MKIIFCIYCAILVVASLAALIVYGTDKRKAIKGERRITERTLFFVSVFGGGVGAALSLLFFHHKGQKGQFVFVIFSSCVLQLGVLALGLYTILQGGVL